MEEKYHVTFSEYDEAISKSSTENDEINFNENRSFPDVELLIPRSKVSQSSGKDDYFPYVHAYDTLSTTNITIPDHITFTDFPTLQNMNSLEESHEFTIFDDHSIHNEPNDSESAGNLEPAKVQDSIINEPIRIESFPTIYEAHGIQTSVSNAENMNDVGTTVGPNLAGNILGMSSYANVTSAPSRKALNFHTLFTPRGNRVDVVVPVESIRAISDEFANTAYGFFLGKRVAYLVVANYVKDTWGKYRLVKLHGVTMTAFSEDGLSAIATKLVTPLMLDSYTFDMCIQSWGRCACCKVSGHVKEKCPKIIKLDVVKNMKKPRQTPRGVLVGPKVGFQPTKQVYRQVPKKNNVSTSVDPRTGMWNLVVLGIPLKRVDSLGDHDSDDQVASVDNYMANFLVSKDAGYGTNSLLEQWNESYGNGEYDYDPYKDDIYAGRDIPNKIQDICDILDIKEVVLPRWSREKHIDLVNIIGEPLAGVTTRSRIRDSEAASAHECLYVNFLSEIEPKKLIKLLKKKDGSLECKKS
ncbi:hypothetical protein Tco_0613740 [Tanacetum coccineum]